MNVKQFGGDNLPLGRINGILGHGNDSSSSLQFAVDSCQLCCREIILELIHWCELI